MQLSRRHSLLAGAGLLAGCLETPVFTGGLDRIHAALFPLADWTRALVDVEVTTPVPVGRSGHGWEPSGGLTADIARSNAFVYLDHPEFGWAQDVADQLARDYESVATIDLLERTDFESLERDDHADGEFSDPHVWVDPVVVQEMVTALADALIELDDEQAQSIQTNAETYRERIATVDEQLSTVIDGAPRSDAVFAGHNSFAHLEARYDLTLHTPVGVSPNAVAAVEDVSDLLEVIETHDIDTILYDPFEAPDDSHPQLVDVLLENSGATDAAALSTLEATTHEWRDLGWGWVEQMTQVTIPALEQALGGTQ